MIKSFPPHPNPLPPGEREYHSCPQQSWGVFWHVFIKKPLAPLGKGMGWGEILNQVWCPMNNLMKQTSRCEESRFGGPTKQSPFLIMKGKHYTALDCRVAFAPRNDILCCRLILIYSRETTLVSNKSFHKSKPPHSLKSEGVFTQYLTWSSRT